MENSFKKKILIESTKCLSQDNDGIQRYGIELLQGLLPIVGNKDNSWEIDVYFGMWFTFNLVDIHEYILSNKSKSDPPVNLRIVLWNIRLTTTIKKCIRTIFPESLANLLELAKGHLDKFFWSFVKPLNFDKYDLVHLILPQSYSFISRSKTSSLVTTVHDLTHLYYPQFHVESNISQAQKGLDFCVARKSAFIAVSESTREDLLKTYNEIDPEAVFRVYEACDPNKFYRVEDFNTLNEVRKTYGISERRYLLSLGTLEPRKNLINTIRAFLLLLKEVPEINVILVIAGKKGWKYESLFTNRALRSDKVIFTGFVADRDLAALYSGALAVSYVSYYEGFGLPALEAMSCGTPVIYGNNSSLPEIVGDGGLAGDPDNLEGIKDKFQLIIQDEKLRERLGQNALHRAKSFSWQKTVNDTLAVYQKVITTSRLPVTP